ncbi:hypothetical protein C8R42DRAFT_727850 [Lentinula raphanica]|nr:hypothetical protein C8R42DRAFT_727850 [Lentinula raphanica]
MSDEVSEVFDLAMRPSMNSLIFQFLFYGIYLILLGIYLSLQRQQRLQNRSFQHPFYPISLLVLFVLATAGIIVSVYDVENVIQEFIVVGFTELSPESRQEDLVSYRTAIGALYATANWVADLILVYRCYHVWNGMLWVSLIPAILSVVNAGISYAAVATIQIGSDELFATGQSSEVLTGDNLNYVFLGINIFNNLLLTGLIAGRIWWLNRIHTRLLGVGGKDQRLNAIASMFVESGTLYPIALIICLIIQVKGSPATMDPILLQIVGIVPTLIMVRTSLGLGVEGGTPAQRDEETELEDDFRRDRYPTDTKNPITSTGGSSYRPTSTFPSEYATTPLRLESPTFMHRAQTPSSVDETKRMHSTAPAYDYRESGPGFRPEKMQTELRYEPQMTSTSSMRGSSFGEVNDPSSPSGNNGFDREKLEPLRYSFQNDIA